MSKAWAGGSSTAWRKTRALVLARDGYRCQVKLPGVCTSHATHVHHTRGKWMGDDPAYLVASCADCNLKLGDVTRGNPASETVKWWE